MCGILSETFRRITMIRSKKTFVQITHFRGSCLKVVDFYVGISSFKMQLQSLKAGFLKF